MTPNFIHLQHGHSKISTSWIDLKILLHKLEERMQISQQILIEFGHQMRKLEHFELDLKLFEDTFDPLGRLGDKLDFLVVVFTI